jgi:phosphohistidine swiveling domain-containing protein
MSSELTSWEAINSQLRALVWCELTKLKRNIAPQVLKQPIAFCTWAEYQAQDFSQAAQRQALLAPLAIYDWAMLPSNYTAQSWQNLSVNKLIIGKAVVITQPSQFKGELPADGIVISPYFDTRWVARIPSLAAIIVQQGGRLSHAALVAREAGIPFCVVKTEVVADIQTGDHLQLNPSQQSLIKQENL